MSAMPEMRDVRIRFTSPHPKDFPLPLLELIADRANICSQLHLPAQSGSTAVLERMRRGYSREAYLELVSRARSIIPGVSFSSDFIAGFCGETEAEHKETLSLIKEVGYDMAFLFAYSLREKTHAHRSSKLADDVAAETKKRRLNELISTWRQEVSERNIASELMSSNIEGLGQPHLVLVEGPARRGGENKAQQVLTGRTDTGKRIVFTAVEPLKPALQPGDYAQVFVTAVTGHTLRGLAKQRSSIAEWYLP